MRLKGVEIDATRGQSIRCERRRGRQTHVVATSRADGTAERALALVRSWVAENELTLHPTKTKIVDARTEGFDFLGYHFRGRLRLPRD